MEFIEQPLVKYIGIGLTLGVVAHLCVKKKNADAENNRRKAYKEGVVILHHFERAKTLPTISPYSLKLETYLRMANIPYENDFSNPLTNAPYGKAPWITYNNQDIGDSNLCIDFLNKELNIDLKSSFSSDQKAIGVFLVAFTESQLAKCKGLHRWVYDDKETIRRMFPWPTFPPFFLIYHYFRRQYNKNFDYARFPREVVERIGKHTLKSLSDFLGDKPFLLGDTPCEADAALFGMLGQIMWALPGSDYEKYLNEDFVNLKNYCYRIKERYWEDWDDCLCP